MGDPHFGQSIAERSHDVGLHALGRCRLAAIVCPQSAIGSREDRHLASQEEDYPPLGLQFGCQDAAFLTHGPGLGTGTGARRSATIAAHRVCTGGGSPGTGNEVSVSIAADYAIVVRHSRSA